MGMLDDVYQQASRDKAAYRKTGMLSDLMPGFGVAPEKPNGFIAPEKPNGFTLTPAPEKPNGFSTTTSKAPSDGWHNGKYRTGGMLIENPENPQNYRYEWFKGALKDLDEDFEKRKIRIDEDFDSGKITGREWDKRMGAFVDEMDARYRKLDWDKSGDKEDSRTPYDAPWYIDLINPQGWSLF